MSLMYTSEYINTVLKMSINEKKLMTRDISRANFDIEHVRVYPVSIYCYK